MAEAENHLSDNRTYRDVKFGNDDLVKLVEQSNKIFSKLLTKQNISSGDFKYFSYNYKKSTNLGKMYLLPKIHKPLGNVPGRPVISNCGTTTEKVSEFLDYHLKPVMQSAKSYIKDTSDFLRKLKELGEVPENAILVTADVVGLYPSIPHSDGLEALSVKLEERVDKSIATKDLLQMTKFVLKNNFFEFNSKIKQVSGTAIGTKFAPPYACIFMDKFETEFLATQVFKPRVWLRYIDDIFFVWTHGEEKLHYFFTGLNEFNPSLKFTYDYSTQRINFLDVIVSKEGNEFVTDLYCKATDCHQYLHYDSCHPDHMKKSSVYSQGLRIKRLCSDSERLQQHLSSLKGWFCERGYPEDIVDEQLQRVKSRDREELLKQKDISETAVGIPFVVTYHPHLKNISWIIKKHSKHLYASLEVKSVFTHLPFPSALCEI